MKGEEVLEAKRKFIKEKEKHPSAALAIFTLIWLSVEKIQILVKWWKNKTRYNFCPETSVLHNGAIYQNSSFYFINFKLCTLNFFISLPWRY